MKRELHGKKSYDVGVGSRNVYLVGRELVVSQACRSRSSNFKINLQMRRALKNGTYFIIEESVAFPCMPDIVYVRARVLIECSIPTRKGISSIRWCLADKSHTHVFLSTS